jgi:hypothetical protein
VLALTLWDTGCSHEIITPVFAEELLRKGARWRECIPLHLAHGNAEHVTAAAPSSRQVCANIMLVHKGEVFEQRDVWLYVYDGAFPDVMLSETFLNNIPCLSSPGKVLLDTRERPGDMQLLQECMSDYNALVVQRFLRPECTTSDLHFCHVNVALQQATEARTGTDAANADGERPATATKVQELKLAMEAQRTRLRHRLGKPVSDEALKAALSVLERYPNNFRPPGNDPCKLAVFKLRLKDNTKYHIALPRRSNPIMLNEMRRQIEELLSVGAIERCASQPSSLYAVVMVQKPGQPGSWRLCLDLVRLNENTVPMPYCMPDVHEALERLSGKKYYSSFDFTAWFQQFEIAHEDREKVAFVIPGDNIAPPQMYQFKRMCFGLMNAGYWSQRQLQEKLEQFPGCAGIYPFVDDVVIASDTLEEHLEKLEAFMKFCEHWNIRIKKEKVQLVTGAVKHLGCILSDEGQTLDPARIDSLLAIGAPTNLKGLKSLLGSFSFIRGWIAGMADTAAPLTDLMGAQAKRMGFQWGPEQEEALEALKTACQIAPALGAPDYTKTFHVSMDASDVGVGAVLWQWQTTSEGKEMPRAIMYCSRRFSDRERRWEISIREMFAVKYALEKFRPYLRGYHDVVLHTDHMNLVSGMYSHSSPKIERWRMFIESCRPFKLVHVRGQDDTQLVADGLSRLHVSNLALEKCPDGYDEEERLQAELGEGGRDENMFETHLATVAHTWERITCHEDARETPTTKPKKKLTDKERDKACNVHNAWASIVNNTREAEMHNVQAISPEEKSKKQRYGVGCDLLKKMGWRISEESHRRMAWEERDVAADAEGAKRGRTKTYPRFGGPGLGYGKCNVMTPQDNADTAEQTAELADLQYLGTVSSSTTFHAHNTHSATAHATTRHTHTSTMTTDSDIENQAPHSRSLPKAAPGHHIERKFLLRRGAVHKQKSITVDTASMEMAALLPTLPDIQERCGNINVTSRSLRRRAHQRQAATHLTQPATIMQEPVGERESKPANRANCNTLCVETQTDVDAFRDAGKLWRGGFPDEALIKRCHDETHASFPVTWRRVIRATGISPGLEQAKMKEQVRRYCDACPTCQKLQPARERVKARQGTIRKRPFAELAFDTIVLNTPDVDGTTQILVVIDSFSHAVELFPLKRATAEAVTIGLHDVLCRWGKPHQVRHDNAKAFAAQVTAQLFKRARVKQHFTAPYSHNSNGQVENANRRVMTILRAMILDQRLGAQTQLQWSLLLPAVRRTMMTRTVLQHGCCPNDLAYAFSPENEDSIFAEEVWMPGMRAEDESKETSKTIAELQRQHEILIDACEQKQDEYLTKLALLHDMEAVDLEPLRPGDFVLVDMRERPHTKITSPWSGPWQVVEEREDNEETHPMMVLQHIASKKIDRFHAAMCKRCNMDLFETLDAAIPYAAMDSFEYEVEAIINHEPRGERKRRRKDSYSFEVLWRGIERGDDNPSWEPWSNESLRASEPFKQYCRRSDVLAELGKDFVAEDTETATAKKKARQEKK